MTVHRLLATIVIGALPLAACNARADTLQHPIEMARSLQMLQDQVVHGSTAALSGQQQLLASMARSLATFDPGQWADPGHVRAIAIYLLNGGPPRAVRDLLRQHADTGAAKPLILALLAYAEQRQDAAELLLRLDALALDPSIAGHVALAQAILAEPTPSTVLGYLATARLLAPGTLIEEAAFRREIKLLVATGKRAQAAQLATRYLWKFRSSVYARELLVHLSDAVLCELARHPETRPLVTRFLEELIAPARKDLLLAMARSSLLEGRIDVAAFASEQARAMTELAVAESARLRIYAAIARSLGQLSSSSVDDLASVDRALLGPEELGLSDATRAVVQRVRAGVSAEPEDGGAPPPSVAKARDAIIRADHSLAEANP